MWSKLKSQLKNFDWRAEGKDMAFILLGITIYAVGFCAFILPHQIVIGGMAGFSTLVFYASNQTIPIAVAMYGTNMLLLACGYKVLGKGFVIRTIIGSTVLSAVIGAMEHYFTTHAPIIADTTFSVATGAVLCGMGIGIYYSHHGTTGGTDIVAAIMSGISNVSVGRVMMVIDVSIVACSFFLPFEGDIEARTQVRAQSIIYGWLSIFIYSYIADKFIYEGRQTVQFIILSERWNEIAHRITHETGRGVTTWDGQGYWTRQGRKLMIVWCRKVDTYHIFRICREVDSEAYVTDSYVKSVYGNGFDTLSVKPRKKNK